MKSKSKLPTVRNFVSFFPKNFRAFRNMDRNGDKLLHEEEFIDGIKQAGLALNADESKYMFQRFDENNNGCIHMDQFLNKLRVIQ